MLNLGMGKTKTYLINNSAFRLQIHYINFKELNISEFSILHLTNFKNNLKNFLSVHINVYSKFFVNLRYINKSKIYKQIIFQYHNKNYEAVSKLLATISHDNVDVTLIRVSRATQRVTGKLTGINYESFYSLKNNDFEKATEENKLKEVKIYTNNNGFTNIAMIIEKHNGKNTFITKVKDFSHHPIDRSLEEYFYKNIKDSSKKIYLHTPNFVNFVKKGNIGYLKLEFVQGKNVMLSDLQEIFAFQSELIDINYDKLTSLNSIEKVYPYLINAKNILPYQNNRLLKSVSQKILQRLNQILNDDDYKNFYQLFRNVYLRPKISNSINLKNDSVLQHKDFGNIKINELGKLIVYDWDGYGLGLPGIDILNFILRFSNDFSFIIKNLFSFLEYKKINNCDVVCVYLTLIYLDQLMSLDNEIEVHTNLPVVTRFLSSSPLNS